MIHIGIDIVKLNHLAAAVSLEGEILTEPFQFSGDYDGFYLPLPKLASPDQHSVVIGLESTAYYGDNPVHFLAYKDFKVCVLNPIMTSSMHKSNVREMKIDKVGTLVVAKILMMQDSSRFPTLEGLDYIKLKELDRFRQKTMKQRTHLKIQLTSYMGQVFPELQYFFKPGLYQKVVYVFLKKAPMPKGIASLHLTHLSNLLVKSSHGHSAKNMVRELGVLTQRSAGLNDNPLSIQIAQTIAQIELLDLQLFETELEMTDLVTCPHSVLTTIPGTGAVNGGMILDEIGDIHRFSTLGKLFVFAGLDPTVYQSRDFQAKRTHMSRRGPRVLRYTPVNAAHDVARNNMTSKAYYNTKRAGGRAHYNALGHCAGRLVRVIWRMLTDGVEFDLEQRPVY